ncbi:MAG TPA: hypothetical protein VFN56_03025 [Candidatus Saccharimonadales bacterium]|nr:hypothetical protein [Candidatus Saccharimonadales bacterium]
MTDKISKELAKFTNNDRQQIKKILLQLKTNNMVGLQVTKLKGHRDIYRLRKGRLRIIYRQQSEGIKILVIERRSEKTYRDF